ncbi:uncharacterized protein LOC117812652 [Notolabrus celidotus]|uniref:uncharacterized protein LOC117812652 n=1 Tax=Notolabrus celidotus TaxID=1203425 RepID=UPI00148FB9CE|nr:uncharacterized protein LOC117812652 [Notolabrus celidotus]
MGARIPVPVGTSRTGGSILWGGLTFLLLLVVVNPDRGFKQSGSGDPDLEVRERGADLPHKEYEGPRIQFQEHDADRQQPHAQFKESGAEGKQPHKCVSLRERKGVSHSEKEAAVAIPKSTTNVRRTFLTHSLKMRKKRMKKHDYVKDEGRKPNENNKDKTSDSVSVPPVSVPPVSVPPLYRAKREVNPVFVRCPSRRCGLNDCLLAYRKNDAKGRRRWGILDPKQTFVRPASFDYMIVSYTSILPLKETPDLWCFTVQQLSEDPDCAQWRVNYRLFPKLGTDCIVQEDEDDWAVVEQARTTIYYEAVKPVGGNSFRPDERNSAAFLMVDYAPERNLSKCWLCQNMPKSMHSPMFTPVPFSKADYVMVDWNGLGSRMEAGTDECYTPAYPKGNPEFSRYTDLALDTVAEVNSNYLPVGVNDVNLLRINSVQPFVMLALQYKLHLTLVQTNCTKSERDLVCVPQPYTYSLLVEALIEIQPWFGTRSFNMVKVSMHNCSVMISDEKTPPRDCSDYIPPVYTYELQNVSLCFRGVGYSNEPNLGEGSCTSVVNVSLKQQPLPERVYLICGNKAYRCMPYARLRGV